MYRFPKREVLGYRHIRSSLLALLNKYQAPSGQGMTEYIVVVAVVAVAAIGVYSMLGQTIRNQTAGIAQEISGNDAGAALNADQFRFGSTFASQCSQRSKKLQPG